MPSLASLTFDNLDPLWFWFALMVGAVAILVLTYSGIYQRSGRRLTWILFGLRLVGVLALFVALVKPAWTQTTTRSEAPKLAIVLDDSQSMSILHKAGGGETYVPRYTQALNWLNDSPSGRALREKFDVTMFGVSGVELDPNKLPAEPTAEQTDLVRGLRAAESRLRGQNAAGVVLISDGRDNTGRDNYFAMSEYPLPVFTVGYRQPPADKNTPFDLAVVNAEAPTRTLVHNAVSVKVLVSKDGGESLDVPIQIERSGVPLLSQRIQLRAGSVPQQAITLNFTPNEPGDFVLAVRIPEQPGERSAVNNTKLFKLRVEADPIRVLYIEGYLRPEYTFLKNRLASDPDIDLITFVRSASPEQAGGLGAEATAELVNAERLKKIDVVLLGDFESSMLDESTYKILREWVEGGGAIMVLGGYHNLTESGLGMTPLAEVLPVELSTSPLAQLEEPFNFKLTDEGRRHPALSITGDMARDASLWESLPSLRGIVAVKNQRPAASVLARHPKPNADAADRLGYIVLATQPFGKGTSAVLTADSTWRWSRITRLSGKPDTLYVRFWSQMVRWLARRDIQSERPALAVSTDSASYDRGQRVTIRVNRNPASMVVGSEGQTAGLILAVKSPDGRQTPLTPTQSADPNLWSATYFPDRGGRFTVDARLVAGTDKGAKDVANQSAEFIVTDSALERDDPSTSPATLQEIARRTGGTYAEIDQPNALSELVEKLPVDRRTIVETRKAGVWNSPGLFILFLVCVSAEWIVRRRNQLV